MTRARTIAGVVAVACAAGTLGGCTRSRARAEFATGNRAYLAEDFARAISRYEKAVSLAPDMAEARFYLANAHEALAWEAHRQEEDGETAVAEGEHSAREREHLLAAVKEYEASAAANRSTAPEFRRLKRDTLECLAWIHATGPLRDGDSALRYVRELEPLLERKPSSAHLVARVLSNAGRPADAEAYLKQERERFPDDTGLCLALAEAVAEPTIEETDRFDEAIEIYESCAAMEPGEAAGPRFLAMAYWSEAYRDARLDDEQKLALADKGLAAADKALALNDEDVEALTYQSFLLRLKATYVEDPGYRRALIAQADAVQDLAIAERRVAAAGE